MIMVEAREKIEKGLGEDEKFEIVNVRKEIKKRYDNITDDESEELADKHLDLVKKFEKQKKEFFKKKYYTMEDGSRSDQQPDKKSSKLSLDEKKIQNAEEYEPEEFEQKPEKKKRGKKAKGSE